MPPEHPSQGLQEGQTAMGVGLVAVVAGLPLLAAAEGAVVPVLAVE